MITEELLKYIEAERKLGKTDERIKATLVADSWTVGDIDEAFFKLSLNNKINLPDKDLVKESKFTKMQYFKKIFKYILFIFLLPFFLYIFATITLVLWFFIATYFDNNGFHLLLDYSFGISNLITFILFFLFFYFVLRIRKIL